MSEPLSDRRLAENEVVFRRVNEKVPQELKALKEQEKSEGHTSVVTDIDMPLHFYCECSDENCRQRIVLTSSEYQQFHQNRSQFIILPGHAVASIERTVFTSENFIVVEKYETPPYDATELNVTPINNT